MLEVEQTAVDESPLNEAFPSEEFDAEQEDGLHDDVVLEVDVCVQKGVLSRRMKGIEK